MDELELVCVKESLDSETLFQECSLRYWRSTLNTSASAMCSRLGIDRLWNLEPIRNEVGACLGLLAQMAAS